MNPNENRVGNRIKSIRQNKGMTQEEFGKLFGASRGNVSLWEKGSSIPNNERLKQLSKVGEMTVNELLDPAPEVVVIKTKNNTPTVIEYKGNRYIMQHKDQYRE